MGRIGRGRVLAALAALAVTLAACGGDAGEPPIAATTDGSSETAVDQTASNAVLGVLDPGVDVADEPADVAAAAFRAGEDGEGLVVGDWVRTDPSGFAQVDWFDGALARVDADSLYALREFDAAPGRAVVVTELDTGRIWNRLRAEEVETYEVVTDVGTAAVRGTAFWVQCGADGGCTFAVLEGEVVVTTTDGTEVVLGPGDEVTVGEDGVPGGVVPTDLDDSWVARNGSLDEQAGFAAVEPPTTGSLAAGDTTCPWAEAPDGWVVRPDPEATGEATEFCRLVATEEAEAHGVWQDLVWIAADATVVADAITEARDVYTGLLAQRAAEADANCRGRQPLDRFIEYDEALGTDRLLGFAWRVVDGCANPNGNSLYGIVADGHAYQLRLSNEAYFEKCPLPPAGGGSQAEVDAWAGCLFDLLETYGQQYRALAAEFSGGVG